MHIDTNQLELNFNIHARQPNFLNSELHYIAAKNENDFKFVDWREEPCADEQKYYCFLVEKELFIPSRNITLKESYVLQNEPIYPIAANAEDFINTIESIPKMGSVKRIRNFTRGEIENIENSLSEKYGKIDTHVVTSDEGQHMLLKVKNIDISISSTMVYFRDARQFEETTEQP